MPVLWEAPDESGFAFRHAIVAPRRYSDEASPKLEERSHHDPIRAPLRPAARPDPSPCARAPRARRGAGPGRPGSDTDARGRGVRTGRRLVAGELGAPAGQGRR